MVVELSAAKLLAPYFGTSIQIWAATLGVTLGGLTVGYFLGSYLSTTQERKNIVCIRTVLLIASLLCVLMPFHAHHILEFTLRFSIGLGATLSLCLFLLPVLIGLGATSPLIIQGLSQHSNTAGKHAGRVYGISTIGGIIGTFFAGFYFIPELGIKFTLLFFGCLLAIATLIILGIKLYKTNVLFLVVFSMASFVSFSFHPEINDHFNVLHESDGLLGNIKVVEHEASWFGQKGKTGRGIMVNNTMQSFMDTNNPESSSIWAWSAIIPSVLSVYPENSKVLLCGLGAGTIAKQLDNLNMDYDVVEIDKRVAELAKEYFGFSKNKEVHIDDARHFIRTSKNKYDIIIFDTFLSESAPEHLLTIESFKEIKETLNKDGLLITNFYGFTTGQLGYAARSVLKTMSVLDWEANIIATSGKEENRNLLFFASEKDIDLSKANYSEIGQEPITDLQNLVIPKRLLNLEDAEILTDENPKLAQLYAKPSLSWKLSYNEYYTKQLYTK